MAQWQKLLHKNVAYTDDVVRVLEDPTFQSDFPNISVDDLRFLENLASSALINFDRESVSVVMLEAIRTELNDRALT